MRSGIFSVVCQEMFGFTLSGCGWLHAAELRVAPDVEFEGIPYALNPKP